jgi:hypothetical protein
MIVVGPHRPRPNPAWRQRLTNVRKDLPVVGDLTVLVTTSLVARGVMTAMYWLAPPAPGTEVSAHPTMASAAAWLDQRRPGTSPILTELVARAKERAPPDIQELDRL